MSTLPDIRGRLLVHSGDDRQAVDRRLDALFELVFDPFAEVEALRCALEESELARGGPESVLGCSYRGVIRLTHDSCGPSGGVDKLLARFYPQKTMQDGRAWRERLFLSRLGFAEAEIDAAIEESRNAELCT